MKIGIDISQTAYEGTGVANYTRKLVENLLKIDKENEYVLFFSSLRKKFLISNFEFLNPDESRGPTTLDESRASRLRRRSSANRRDKSQILNPNFQIKQYKIPPTILEFLWNQLHICPIEWFIGEVDVFLSSDWTQPPSKKAKLVTVVHDLTSWKHPETFNPKIVRVHKRRMKWVKKECDFVICDCEATKKDLIKIIGIDKDKVKVIYPGVNIFKEL